MKKICIDKLFAIFLEINPLSLLFPLKNRYSEKVLFSDYELLLFSFRAETQRR